MDSRAALVMSGRTDESESHGWNLSAATRRRFTDPITTWMARRHFRRVNRKRFWIPRSVPLETSSGPGSYLATTAELRTNLATMLRVIGTQCLLDLPCGEWGFMSEVDLQGIQYVGCDIVPEIVESNKKRFQRPFVSFVSCDGVRDPLPKADTAFVKDFFQHISNIDILRCLASLRTAGVKYLITSSDTYPFPSKNSHRPKRGHLSSCENLTEAPFNLGSPIVTIALDAKYYSIWSLVDEASQDRIENGLVSHFVMSAVPDDLGDASHRLGNSKLFRNFRLWCDGEIGDCRTYLIHDVGGVIYPGLPSHVTRLQQMALEGIEAGDTLSATVGKVVGSMVFSGRGLWDDKLEIFDARRNKIVRWLESSAVDLTSADSPASPHIEHLGWHAHFAYDAYRSLGDSRAATTAGEEQWVSFVQDRLTWFYAVMILLGYVSTDEDQYASLCATLSRSLHECMVPDPPELDILDTRRWCAELLMPYRPSMNKWMVRSHELANTVIRRYSLSIGERWGVTRDTSLEMLMHGQRADEHRPPTA